MDRAILEEGAKQDLATMENEIQSLMPGEAIVSSPYTPFALPVMVHRYEEFVGRLKEEAARAGPTSTVGPVDSPAGAAVARPAQPIQRDKDFY